ncbi:hypothetical protein SKAU_G00070060 [Synaphobranchus kaupii]|uniref:Secreted protein n=1 Tax=Synaphobranchus kaupii TaxID=118154 RepID=A0A9Q1JAF5_SYNKA|nr:hypothetical protein SKAU_G00070060 [Synaphobranchus kaupii]
MFTTHSMLLLSFHLNILHSEIIVNGQEATVCRQCCGSRGCRRGARGVDGQRGRITLCALRNSASAARVSAEITEPCFSPACTRAVRTEATLHI